MKLQAQALLVISLLFLATALAADLLQNADFELPPSNVTVNSTGPVELFNNNNTIPGWTFEGTVIYIPFPGNGHAIQLGQDGMINQTFIASGGLQQYLLTFNLAKSGSNCSSNTSLVVSAPDIESAFSPKQNYVRGSWESYGCQLGSWGNGESINLVFQSRGTEVDPNLNCWPIVDSILIKSVIPPTQNPDDLLFNGGFELGPEFPVNSTNGVLLDAEPSIVQSALQQWSVMGTIKYIDSKHYYVPEGNAAIEIVSGASSGVQTSLQLRQGSSYNLRFMLGDANDSCRGDFIVGVLAGSLAQNFTLQSNGTGSVKNFSMIFTADSVQTSITFQSYSSSQNRDGVFCGPMVDGVVLHTSTGPAAYHNWVFLIVLIFLAVF